MALTTLTSANSFTAWDGTVSVFVGNVAVPTGKLRVARTDGTGPDVLNAVPFATSSGLPGVILYLGDSHIAGGDGPGVINSLRTASGAWGALDLANHVYAVSGHTTQQMRALQLPAAEAWIAANESSYSQFIVFVGGGINNGPTATDQTALTNQVVADRRYICQRLALTNPKVKPIILGTPPTTNYYDTDNPRYTLINNARVAWDADARDNYATQYMAAAFTATFLLDPIYTPEYHLANVGQFQDGTHYGSALSTAWCTRHWLRPLLNSLDAPAATRPVPTALAVDAAAKTLTFALATGTPLVAHQYSLNAGSSYAPVPALPLSLPDGTYAAGAIRVRVKAYGGSPAGAAVQNTVSVTITATPPAGNGYTPVQMAASATTGFDISVAGVAHDTVGNGGSITAATQGIIGAGSYRLPLKGANRGVNIGFGAFRPGSYVGQSDYLLAFEPTNAAAFQLLRYGAFVGGDVGNHYPYAENDVLTLIITENGTNRNAHLELNGVLITGTAVANAFAGLTSAIFPYLNGLRLGGGVDDFGMKSVNAFGPSVL